MLGRKDTGNELAKRDGRDVLSDRWLNPWDDLDRMFEDFFTDRWLMPLAGARMTAGTPRVDITDEGDHLTITADMPGVPKENVEVEVQDGILHLRSKLDEERKEEGKAFIRRERRFSSFHRGFMLPDGVKEDAIEANMRDGVLSVKVPKAKPPEPKAVKVKVE